MSGHTGGRWDEDIDWTDLPARAERTPARPDPEIRREPPPIGPTEEFQVVADPGPVAPLRPHLPARPRRARTIRVTTAAAVGIGCLIVGGVLGYIARGGAPQAEPTSLTQTIPQVTVTERAATP